MTFGLRQRIGKTKEDVGRFFKSKVFSWGLVLLWMILIFFFSAQPGEASAHLSQGITEIIIEVIETAAPQLSVDWQSFHLFVRKNAHFFVYLVLGVMILRAITKSKSSKQSKPISIQACAIALIMSAGYAVTDEVHQIFVPGRSGQVSDVLIDTLGALTGIILYSIYWYVRSRRKSKMQ